MDDEIISFETDGGGLHKTSRKYLDKTRKNILKALDIIMKNVDDETSLFIGGTMEHITDRDLVTSELSATLNNFASYISLADERMLDEGFSKLSFFGTKGGKITHPDKRLFQSDYRNERASGVSRVDCIEALKEFYPAPKGSTLVTWATEADKDDGYIRKGGRPPKKKGS